jgi:hypothetical protein
MTTIKLNQGIVTSVSVIALAIIAAPVINAQCAGRARSGGTSGSALSSPGVLTALDQVGAADQPGPSEPQNEVQNDSATITGLWKHSYFTEGVLFDIGFRQFNAGGTELLNDSFVPDGGNNFCMGSWRRVGRRTYAVVHPYFLFSGSQPTGIAIERAHIIVGPDGNTFSGTWSSDNYDFAGNLVLGSHSQGTLSATRIVAGLPFPFPFLSPF